jgi:hypothetical protein
VASYAWFVGVLKNRTFVVLGAGGGCISAQDNPNAKITSARAEALCIGVACCCGYVQMQGLERQGHLGTG